MKACNGDLQPVKVIREVSQELTLELKYRGVRYNALDKKGEKGHTSERELTM